MLRLTQKLFQLTLHHTSTRPAARLSLVTVTKRSFPGRTGKDSLPTSASFSTKELHRKYALEVDSMDDLCRKHMDLPAQEFAMGCSFLHQIALGIPLADLASIVHDRPSLINFRDYDRRTPLHIAASEGHFEICQYLLEQGARINRSDRWGGSPLDDAQRHDHAEVISLLKLYGATFGSPSQANNFIAAASEGDVEEIKELLEFGNMDLNHGDYDKRTALHLAASNGRSEVVKILCKAGADVNLHDRWGNRPLDDAVNAGHQDCVDILEQYGGKASTNSAAAMGQEALLDLMQTYGKMRNGKLTMDWHDVKDLLEGVGQTPTDQVVQKLFQAADVNRSGVIDANEFIAHSEVFLGGRPARIILVVGGPGSGKGVLSERLVKECGVVHLSSGELLRQEVEQGTELGKHVEDIMKSGGLVSSAIMVALMQKRMKDHPGKRILLDGFPRSRENAEDLVTLCGKPELALHLTCDDTVLLERIMKRGESGARADDNIQTAIQRIRTYHKYHKVTLDFLRDKQVPVVFLDCEQTPDGVWEQLRSIGRLMRSAVRLPVTGAGSRSPGNGL